MSYPWASSVEGRRVNRRPGKRRRIALGIFLVCVGASAWLAAWALHLARPAACQPMPMSDLSLDEMISVKRRIQAHERDPSATMALTGAEASFLLRDNLNYPVQIAVHEDTVSARLALPDETGRCYNVAFEGHVDVRDGVAHVVPASLVVGDLDLTPMLAGTSMAIDPRDVTSEHVRALLSHVRVLEIVDGHLVVRIDDLKALR